MAKAKKLPSGSWRVNQYVGKDADGKRMYKSFTADSKKEAEFMAAEYVMNNDRIRTPTNLTVGTAMDRYIESRDTILSPSSVREYKRIRAHDMQGIMDIQLDKLTPELVQLEINREAKTHSAASVRNMHGLLYATLKEYYPSFVLRTKLPRKEKPEIQIPTKETVDKLITLSKGTEMEISILLAACMGLRRSEIVGLKWDKIDFESNTLSIKEAIVYGENYEVYVKKPKSTAGDRTLDMPKIVADALKRQPRTSEYVVNIDGNGIYKRFTRLLKNNDIPHFRFHDLRHYNASVMLALGVPDKYAMERMGHATNVMLKQVYQHTMQDEQKKISEHLNSYFSGE